MNAQDKFFDRPIGSCQKAEPLHRSATSASYIFFGGKNLTFLGHYEDKMKEHQLLTILKDNLTDKGLETYNKINKYLTDNLDKYMIESQK
jgi:hypothetical protein